MTDQVHEPLLHGTIDQGQQTIIRILKAAECSFYGHGYHATTMQQIAEVAEVSKSLLHYHFQSKEHLFLELQINLYNRLADAVLHVLEGETSTRARGMRALDELFSVFRASDDLPIQLEIWQRALTNDTLREHVLRFQRFVIEALGRVLTRIVAGDESLLPIDLDAATHLVWAVLAGLKVLSGFQSDPNRVEHVFEGFKTIVGLALAATRADSQ